MELVEFLRARLDEDERLARDLMQPYAWGYSVFYEASKEELAHIERWRPFRALAEIKGKRAILAEHLPWTGKQNDAGVYCSTCVGYPISSRGEIGVAWPCLTVRLLAQPFADHPEFDPAWKP